MEIGVIQKRTGSESNIPGTVASVGEFAATIAERYAPQTLIASRADLALVWEPPPEVNYFEDSRRVEITPSLSIDLRSSFSAVARELGGVAPDRAGYGEKEAGELFERLFSRHMRVSTFAVPHSTLSDPVAGAARPAAVDRAIPQSRPGKNVVAQSSQAGQEAPDAGWGTRPIFAAEPKPLTLPAPEIKRVADQVMREIDRRVSATRERMGRR